jgi:hypothetical protein
VLAGHLEVVARCNCSEEGQGQELHLTGRPAVEPGLNRPNRCTAIRLEIRHAAPSKARHEGLWGGGLGRGYM